MRRAALVASPRDRVHVGLGGIHRDIHVGEFGRDQLEPSDRLTELLALVHIRDHDVEAGLHDPKRTSRKNNAFVVKAGHQDIDTVANRTQHVFSGTRSR